MTLKFVHVILLAAVKFILTLPYALVIGMSYSQALTAVLIGGIGGFLFFYYISKYLSAAFYKVVPLVCMWFPMALQDRFQSMCSRLSIKKKTRIFSRRNRIIARIRKSYGLWGIIIATPVLLTIPIGAFLTSKYYPRRKFVVMYMILSIVAWTAVLSGIVHLFPRIFF